MIKRRHFSLIELIIASTMLVIAMLGGSAFYFANRRNLTKARIQRQATWEAVNQMEGVKKILSDENKIDLENDTVYVDGDDGNFTLENRPAHWELKIEKQDEGGNIKWFKATVTVSWNGGDDEVEIVTYVADDWGYLQ